MALRWAHVGFTNSDEDTTRMLVALHTIARFDNAFLKRGVRRAEDITHDHIDLRNGRDFLAENREYEIVVVHSVFHASILERGDHVTMARFEAARISPHHTIERWRHRLLATKAGWIVVCEGQPCSLSGWNIGDLPGYKMAQADSMIVAYQKEA